MDITVAYFHPLLHPEAVKRDFEQIRAVGAGSIVYAIHEQEEQRWSHDLERGLSQAHDTGLKVYLSLGRYGSLFSGSSLTSSWYTLRHPESCVKDRHGRSHIISCFNHESFRSWLFKEVEYYLSTYPIDGIVIDEPRGPDITCFCSVCRALCPDVTDLQRFRRCSMINFLGELCAHVKHVAADAKTTVVLLPEDLEQVDELAALPLLDTIGCHLSWQLVDEEVTMVQQWGHEVVEAAQRHNKHSQLWLQNFSLDQQGERELELAFSHILNAGPDEVACYYYWRNNVDPERVWQTTRDLLRRAPRRQLHWQTTLARVPLLYQFPPRESQQTLQY